VLEAALPESDFLDLFYQPPDQEGAVSTGTPKEHGQPGSERSQRRRLPPPTIDAMAPAGAGLRIFLQEIIGEVCLGWRARG
jgi:hypothetical protein